MKRDKLVIIIVVLLAMQIYSLYQISSQKREIEGNRARLSSLQNQLEKQISSIYQNVDEKLKEKASIIKASDYIIGEVDVEKLEAPVTFTIVPKESTDNTKVFLDFSGKTIRLEKQGTTFTGSENIEISSEINPTVIVETNGVKHLEDNYNLRIGRIADHIFPKTSFPRYSGKTSYSSKGYEINGSVSFDVKASNESFIFEKVYYISKINNKIYSRKEMEKSSDTTFSLEIDERIPLEDGEVLTTHVLARDNLGFSHEFFMEHYVAGSNMQREPYFGEKRVYSPDMELLFESKY